MRKHLYLIILLLSLLSAGCITKHMVTKKVVNEIRHFIDTVKVNVKGLSKSFVYVLVGIEADSINKCDCFSLSYILHDFEFTDERTNYYFKIDTNYILAYINESTINHYLFKGLGIKKIDSKIEDKILNKLCPSKKNGSVWSYIAKGEIICIHNDIMTKQFFRNAYQMPYIYRKWKLFGPVIEQHKAGDWFSLVNRIKNMKIAIFTGSFWTRPLRR